MNAYDAVERTNYLLDESVKKQLESDVDLGSFLSGGIDSSLVSYYARQHLKELKTYTVKFFEDSYDESTLAKLSSKTIGSVHNEVHLSNSIDHLEYLDNLIMHLGQPFADSSILPTNLICKEIKKYFTWEQLSLKFDQLYKIISQ